MSKHKTNWWAKVFGWIFYVTLVLAIWTAHLTLATKFLITSTVAFLLVLLVAAGDP